MNDSVGTMSSWYVYSSIGFFSVSPRDTKFVLKTPSLDKVIVKIGN